MLRLIIFLLPLVHPIGKTYSLLTKNEMQFSTAAAAHAHIYAIFTERAKDGKLANACLAEWESRIALQMVEAGLLNLESVPGGFDVLSLPAAPTANNLASPAQSVIFANLTVAHGQGRDVQFAAGLDFANAVTLFRIGAIGQYNFVCDSDVMTKEEFMKSLRKIAGGRYAPNEVPGVFGTLDYEAFKARVWAIVLSKYPEAK